MEANLTCLYYFSKVFHSQIQRSDNENIKMPKCECDTGKV